MNSDKSPACGLDRWSCDPPQGPAVHAPMRVRTWMLLTLVAVLVAGCASVPKDYPRTASSAFPDYASTVIGAYLEKAAASHPDQSGFAILPDGRRAFTSRIAMTELAEKTLDLQYLHLGRRYDRVGPCGAPCPRGGPGRPCAHPGR